MSSQRTVQAGDWVAIGRQFVQVEASFAESLEEGDELLAIAHSGILRRIPAEVITLVDQAMSDAQEAFSLMASVSDDQITHFFEHAAQLMADDVVFKDIATANKADVVLAEQKGRSTTRLVLSEEMRRDMVSALRMWRDAESSRDRKISQITHDGWSVEERRTSLGVLGFVFEGRPNVFADATGVLRGGNTVVFRIGSDALGTAQALMSAVVAPALFEAGLPRGAVVLIASPEHAAGWALFSDSRLSLAIARGSGEAVAELGSIAQQSGIPVSLHGTGGAWMIVGKSQGSSLSLYVQHSLDRKVCNTLNVVCVLRENASVQIPIVVKAAIEAASSRQTRPVIHFVSGAENSFDGSGLSELYEKTVEPIESLAKEYEWENCPEFSIVLVDSIEEATELFNKFSPQFIVSVVSDLAEDEEMVWAKCNAPFVGNGFTRWVDGQFALLRPELGLSNWEQGRLFSRAGVLSGDSAFSVRLRVRQTDPYLHR